MKSKVQAAKMRTIHLIKGIARRDRVRNIGIKKGLKLENIFKITDGC